MTLNPLDISHVCYSSSSVPSIPYIRTTTRRSGMSAQLISKRYTGLMTHSMKFASHSYEVAWRKGRRLSDPARPLILEKGTRIFRTIAKGGRTCVSSLRSTVLVSIFSFSCASSALRSEVAMSDSLLERRGGGFEAWMWGIPRPVLNMRLRSKSGHVDPPHDTEA